MSSPPRIPSASLPSAAPRIRPPGTRNALAGAAAEHALRDALEILQRAESELSQLATSGCALTAHLGRLLDASSTPSAADQRSARQAAANFADQLALLDRNIGGAEALCSGVARARSGSRERCVELIGAHRELHGCLNEWNAVSRHLDEVATAYARMKTEDKRMKVIVGLVRADNGQEARLHEKADEVQRSRCRAMDSGYAAHRAACASLARLLKRAERPTQRTTAAADAVPAATEQGYEIVWALASGSAGLLTHAAVALCKESLRWHRAAIAALRQEAARPEPAAPFTHTSLMDIIAARKQAVDSHAPWQTMRAIVGDSRALLAYWTGAPPRQYDAAQAEQAKTLREASLDAFRAADRNIDSLVRERYSDLIALVQEYGEIGAHVQGFAAAPSTVPGRDDLALEHKKILNDMLETLPLALGALKQLMMRPDLLPEKAEAAFVFAVGACGQAQISAADSLFQPTSATLDAIDRSGECRGRDVMSAAAGLRRAAGCCHSAAAALHRDLPSLPADLDPAVFDELRDQLCMSVWRVAQLFQKVFHLRGMPAYGTLPDEVQAYVADACKEGSEQICEARAFIAPDNTSDVWGSLEAIELCARRFAYTEKNEQWRDALQRQAPDANVLRGETRLLLQRVMQGCSNLSAYMELRLGKLREATSDDPGASVRIAQHERMLQGYQRQHGNAYWQAAHIDLLTRLDKQPNLQTLYFMLVRRAHVLASEMARADAARDEGRELAADELAGLAAGYEQLASDIESFDRKLGKKHVLHKEDEPIRAHITRFRDGLLARCTEAARRAGLNDPRQEQEAVTPEALEEAQAMLSGLESEHDPHAPEAENDDSESADAVPSFRDYKSALAALTKQTADAQALADTLAAEATGLLNFAREMKHDLGNPLHVQRYFELAAQRKSRAARRLTRVAAGWARTAPRPETRTQQQLTERAGRLEREAAEHAAEGARAFLQLTKARAPTADSLVVLLDRDEVARVTGKPRTAYTPRSRTSGAALLGGDGQAKTSWLEEYIVTLKSEPGQPGRRWAVHAHYPTRQSDVLDACHVKEYDDRRRGAGYEAATGNMVYRSRVSAQVLDRLRAMTRPPHGTGS